MMSRKFTKVLDHINVAVDRRVNDSRLPEFVSVSENTVVNQEEVRLTVDLSLSNTVIIPLYELEKSGVDLLAYNTSRIKDHYRRYLYQPLYVEMLELYNMIRARGNVYKGDEIDVRLCSIIDELGKI